MKNFRSLRATLLLLVILCPVGAFGAGFSNMYIIGDSLSDQGNMFFATKSLIGSGIPAADHYWEGRFANGNNYVDALSNIMGITTSTYSLSGGNNFADGGARVDYNTVENDDTKPYPVSLLGQGGVFPADVFPWTLDTQRNAFVGRGVLDPDALFVVFAGSNDLSDLITMVALHSRNMFPDPDPATFMLKMLQSVNQTIAAYVASGARNILVPNVPNLGLMPAVTIYGPDFSRLAADLTAQYNAALALMLSQQWEASGYVNIIPFDTYSLLTNVVNNPAAYGFSNATTPCYTGFVGPAGPGDTVCTTPDSYVFWDREHPTTAAHAVLADRMRAAIVLDILDDLINKVNNGIPAGLKNSLSSKLGDARKVLTDSNTTNDVAAAELLEEFIDLVNVQVGKKIPRNTADYLIGQAEKIIPLIASGK